MLTITKINAAQRKVDDGRVLLLNEDVLGKSFEMEDNVLRQDSALVSA